MSMKQKNVPKLRFPEFTEEWKQHKLGEIGVARSGVGFPDSEQGGLEGTPFFKVSDMNTEGNENELITANNYVTDEQINRKRWTVISDVPAIFFAKVGAAVMLNRKRLVRVPFLLDNNTMAYIFNKDAWDCDFGKTLFETIDLTKLTQVGALPSYNSSDVEEVMISIPKRSEQETIGRYFKQLDNLITLQQRKLDQIKEYKKGILQKMFPKEGKSVPEVRFPGFDGEWEKRKLGDEAIEILAGGDINKEKTVENGKYPIYANALTNDGIVGYYDDYYRVKAPAVTVTGRGEVGYAQARLFDFTPVVRLLAIRSVHDCYFLENAINEHGVIVESTGVPQLTVPQLSAYKIFFPKDIEEEIKIGQFFHNIDNLIALHQRKLDAMKEYKKGLLQQMFV